VCCHECRKIPPVNDRPERPETPQGVAGCQWRKVTNGLFEADAGVLHASDVKPASLCVRVLDDDPTATDTGPATAPARRTETVLNASGLPVVVRCGITGT
jgi:hypothetical protein